MAQMQSAVNLYATFSKGFKSGTFNSSSLQVAPVDPEKITAFEAGVKGELADMEAVGAVKWVEQKPREPRARRTKAVK